MGFQTPRLDDRSFEDLVAEARARIPLYTPEWTDHNLSDPGITLIELFSWLIDITLYRLNRVPDKHFVKFMELVGMRLHEAEPARAPVTFWLTAPQPNNVTIPGGTEVSTVRTETEPAIIFTTDGSMEIKVPQLAHVMTSYGEEGQRTFLEKNAEGILNGYENFLAFASTPPAHNDALYLGFEEDLSNHILGIHLDVNIAEGAGVDPRNPPYIFEVLKLGTDDWVEAEKEVDTTQALNVSGMIRIHLPEIQRAVRNEVMAYWVRCRLNITNMENRYNVSPQINRLRVDSWGGTVYASNLTRVTEEVMGRSDGTPGQRFYLEHKPLIARTAEEHLVVVHDSKDKRDREEHWQEVADFSSSSGSDRHYTIDSESGEVRFGPALPQRDGQLHRYGALPPKGTLLKMLGYRYGGGQRGNVAKNTLTVMKTALPYIARVSNREAAQGGLDGEDLENAKTRVPGYLRSLGRAVTADDFVYLTHEAAPGQIQRAYCLQPPKTNLGEIRMLVIPSIPRLQGYISPESLELPNDVRESIQAFLDERRLLSTRLEVSQPIYQWVETQVRFQPSEHYDPERVRKAVEDKLFEFINPVIGGTDGKGWPFGRSLYPSDIIAVLQTVPGVNFIRSVRLIPINYAGRQPTRGAERQVIDIPADGVAVSYQHDVRVE